MESKRRKIDKAAEVCVGIWDLENPESFSCIGAHHVISDKDGKLFVMCSDNTLRVFGEDHQFIKQLKLEPPNDYTRKPPNYEEFLKCFSEIESGETLTTVSIGEDQQLVLYFHKYRDETEKDVNDDQECIYYVRNKMLVFTLYSNITEDVQGFMGLAVTRDDKTLVSVNSELILYEKDGTVIKKFETVDNPGQVSIGKDGIMVVGSTINEGKLRFIDNEFNVIHTTALSKWRPTGVNITHKTQDLIVCDNLGGKVLVFKKKE